MTEELIQSRKIATKSLSRHFVPWKPRYFRIDRETFELIVTSVVNSNSNFTDTNRASNSSVGNNDVKVNVVNTVNSNDVTQESHTANSNSNTLVVPISHSSFQIKHHYYSKDWKFLLSLKFSYYRNSSGKDSNSGKHSVCRQGAEMEISMKCESIEQLTRWIRDLTEIKRSCQVTKINRQSPAVLTLKGLLQEQITLQNIVENSQDRTSSKDGQVDTNNHLNQSNVSHTFSNIQINSKRTDLSFELPKLTVPNMRIVIMAVGTRGDMQPFTQLGARLQADGHRVRVATHSCFRDYIIAQGLEFYPIAGDPVKLSEFMVKTQGFVIPTTTELIFQVPAYHSMIVEIIYSCWYACVSPDPLDSENKQFIADAIISNPVTYGHIHCAEALGIPLHLMFPQPWIATKAFPHPMARMSYSNDWSAENHLSYQLINMMFWLSFEKDINAFRTNVLGLEPLRIGDAGWNFMNLQKIPFSCMWSPSLVPKPKDWPEWVDIVGTFDDRINNVVKSSTGTEAAQNLKSVEKYRKQAEENSSDDIMDSNLKTTAESPTLSNDFIPTEELVSFLGAQGPVVFVGFGSMVIKDLEQKIAMFLEAAAVAGIRLIVQVGWSELSPIRFKQLALEAQQKANIIREMEHMNNSLEDLIFPGNECSRSPKATTKPLFNSWFGSALSLTGFSPKDSKNADPKAINVAASNAKHQEIIRSDANTYKEDLSTWDVSEFDNCWRAASDALLVGPLPHSWLFERVTAVVHHGGAGTTSAALRRGKPSWICPFFGDQFFWGEMVHRAGLGPNPCHIDKIDLHTVVAAFEMLTSSKVIATVKSMSHVYCQENGAERAVEAFYRHLPVTSMTCDVSATLGTSRLAQIYCKQCGVKMCAEVSRIIHGMPGCVDHEILPCTYTNWSTQEPESTADGLIRGIGGLLHEITSGMTDVIYDPVRGLYSEGLNGAAAGLVTGLNSLLKRPFTGGNLLVRRVQSGWRSNFIRGHEAAALEAQLMLKESSPSGREARLSISDINNTLRDSVRSIASTSKDLQRLHLEMEDQANTEHVTTDNFGLLLHESCHSLSTSTQILAGKNDSNAVTAVGDTLHGLGTEENKKVVIHVIKHLLDTLDSPASPIKTHSRRAFLTDESSYVEEAVVDVLESILEQVEELVEENENHIEELTSTLVASICPEAQFSDSKNPALFARMDDDLYHSVLSNHSSRSKTWFDENPYFINHNRDYSPMVDVPLPKHPYESDSPIPFGNIDGSEISPVINYYNRKDDHSSTNDDNNDYNFNIMNSLLNVSVTSIIGDKNGLGDSKITSLTNSIISTTSNVADPATTHKDNVVADNISVKDSNVDDNTDGNYEKFVTDALRNTIFLHKIFKELGARNGRYMTTTEVTNLVARAMARAEALTNVPATDDYNANTDRADLPSVAVANSLVEATEDVNEAEGLWYSNSTNSTLSIVHEIEVENSNNNSNSLLLESITSVRTMNTNNTVDAVMPEAAIATANPVTEARELVKIIMKDKNYLDFIGFVSLWNELMNN